MIRQNNEIYGVLNQEVKEVEYTGGSTNTATVHINDKLITVDAKIDTVKIESEYANVLTKFDEVKQYFTEIQTKISSYEKRFTEINYELDVHTESIAKNSTEITQLKTDLAEVDVKLEKLKVDVQEIIDTKIVEIEKQIAALKTEINKQLKDVVAKIDDLEARLDGIIEKALVTIKEQIAVLQADTTQLKSDVTALQTLTSKHTEDIAKLQKEIDNISETILPLIESKLQELSEKFDVKLKELSDKVDSRVSELIIKIDTGDKVLDEKIAQTNTKVDNVDAKVDTADAKIDTTKSELENSIESVQSTLTKRIDATDEEVSNKLNTSKYTYDKEIIDATLIGKGSAMYYDTTGEFDPSGQAKSYWYMTNKNTLSPTASEVIAGPYNFGSGGGGGGGTVTTKVKVEAIDWPSTIAFGTTCKLQVNWSSLKDTTPTGNGTLTVYVNSSLAFTQRNTPQGLVTLDVTSYIVEGTNSVEVRATDAYANTDKIIQELTTVQISLDSLFNANRIFTGDIRYIYTPYGSGIEKIVYFFVDDELYGTQETQLSGEEMSYVISDLTHGSHSLKVYFKCNVGGNEVTSNELIYDLIYSVDGDENPVIASTFNDLEQEQYNSFNIPYRVYTPGKNYSEIQLSVNGEIIQELTVNQDEQTWEYRSIDYGDFTMQIICGTTVRTFQVVIKESEIDVHPAPNHSLYLTATGRSNSEAEPWIWEDKDNNISCNLEGFNFVSDGWLLDDDGNTALKITGDARVEIPIKPFKDDFRANGKTIEIEFATSSITNYESIIMSCWSGERGFYITPQLAKIKSQQSELFTQYKEDEHVRVTFVVEKKEGTHLILMYLNGIMSGAVQYPTNDDFSQLTPVTITIGSSEATIDIYNIRTYEYNIDRKQVVNNWIYDTQSGELKRDRYIRNDNYNTAGELVASKLPSTTPYIIWDIDPLPQYKGDKRNGQAYYKDPTNSKKNFSLPTDGGTPTGSYNVQGTSSAAYPVKNIRLKSSKGFVDDDLNVNPYFYITDDGIGANYFTFKVDYASCEGANNVELTRLYNDAAKAKSILNPAQKLNSKVRVGIDGFPIVAFHRDSNKVDSFCTKANFNNDKANEDVYGFREGDESWEITNNSADEANFKKPATAETFANAFEIRFPDKDGYSDLTKLGPMTEWVVSTDPEQATGAELAEPKQYTYKTVIRSEDGTYSELEITSPLFTNDTADYRLVKFKAELADWFDTNSTLFYYIFTHLFLLVDSRAKNAFPTYFTSRNRDEEGNPQDGGDRWFWLPYDMDTAIGINNEGKLVFDYNLEDTDKVEGANVFNGQDSVIWNNLRKMFDGEIGKMYSELRTSGSLISYDTIENRFETHQAKWSENIFNEDSYQKYIKILADTGANYLEMLQGSKAEQRKWWLYNRFKYFDSKYLAGSVQDDRMQFRAYGKGDITITPYADIYATVSYANTGNYTVSVRAKRNEPYVLKNPLPSTAGDQETYIYAVSQLKSIGDLSPMYPGTIDVSLATRLQDLKVGDGAEGYVNEHLTSLTLGQNTLLKTLDVRNCPSLTSTIDISNCTNVEYVYFDGTSITGLQLPAGGILKTLHLPNTITNLEIRNQQSLEDLVLAGTGSVTSLWLEDIPMNLIDAKTLIMGMPAGGKVRLIDFNQTVNNADEIYDLYAILDTMTGMDKEGVRTDDAQFEGNILIDNITYEDYVALTHHMKDGRWVYKNVNIVYNRLVCKVRFFKAPTFVLNTYFKKIVSEEQEEYVLLTVEPDDWDTGFRNYYYKLDDEYKSIEGVLHNEQNVDAGKPATTPEIPTKQSTKQYHYHFVSWNKDFSNIQESMDIDAIFTPELRKYTITFDTQTPRAHVDPVEVYYGQTVPKPADPYIEGTTFLGWFTEPDCVNPFDFEKTIIDEDKTLYGKWRDDSAPSISLERKTYNIFKYTLTDNIGIVKYAFTSTPEEPTVWIEIEPQSPVEGEYTVTGNGTTYVHAKDQSGKSTTQSINSFNLYKNVGTGTFITLRENDTELSGFALEGTSVKFIGSIDSHYNTLICKLNDEGINPEEITEIHEDLYYSTSATPNKYTVHFEIGEKGDPSQCPDQTVTYLEKAEEPIPQYVEGEIAKDWYLSTQYLPEERWEFTTNFVTGNTTLYAKWEEYQEPSVITIKVDTVPQEVVAWWYQSTKYGVEIDWDEEGSSIYTPSSVGTVSAKHTYSTAGTYKIKLRCVEGYHYLGGGWGKQVVTPSSLITGIDFAWNLSKVNAYTLYGATQLKSVEIPKFMSEVSIGLFQNCTALEEVKLPNTLPAICNAAFQGCSALTGTFEIPDSVKTLGNYAFAGCTGLSSVKLSSKITTIDEGTFSSCSSMKSFTIPSNITTIKSQAFGNCIALTKLVIPDTVQNVSSYAFYGSYGLRSVGPIGGDYNIEIGWTDKIPDYVFEQSSVTTAVLPDTITEIGVDAFASTSLKSITLPLQLKTIRRLAFYGCGSLKEITLPDSLVTIESNAFNRSGLLNITLPDNVQDMGVKAFANCNYLHDIYIRFPASLTTIDVPTDGWFYSSRALAVIHIKNISSPTTAYGVYYNYFSDSVQLTVKVDIED